MNRRALGIWSATALVVGNMVGSGVFLLPASLAPYGATALIGWAITLVGTLALAATFARLAMKWPHTGGPYAFARAGFGDAAGFLIAWSYWVSIWSANAAIAVSRAQIGQCNVVAPFSGHVVRVHVKPHQGVNVGAPLVEMVGDGPLKVRLNAPSRLLRTLQVGTPFEVSIDETGKTYSAKVTALNARVDAVAQTVELEGRIDGKPAELLAGMTGTARFK